MKSSYLWLVIEQLVFMGTLMSNISYLMFRSCIRSKLSLDTHDIKKQLPNADTVTATKETINAFNAQFVPFVVNIYLNFAPTGDKGAINLQLNMILASNMISMIAIFYLIFVPWKKGPDWYTKHSFKLFKSLLYLNYVWLPFINIAITVFFTLNPRFDLKLLPLESWVVFFSVVCFARLVEFYSNLRKVVLDDARIFISARKDKENAKLSELTESVLEKDEVTLFAESERDKIIRERQQMEE